MHRLHVINKIFSFQLCLLIEWSIRKIFAAGKFDDISEYVVYG